MIKSTLLYCATAVLTLASCGDNAQTEPATPANSATASADAPKAEDTSAPAAQEITLPVIIAAADKQRFTEWGSKPEEETEGPTDPWVWTHMMCSGVTMDELKVSSTLAPQGKNDYKAANLGDDNPTTAWVEGNADYGIGEYIELKGWQPMGDGTVSILNGYQASRSSWENNSRVKQFKVSLGTKDYCIVELSDVMGTQEFRFPRELSLALDKTDIARTNLRFTIVEVYPGLKWKDTAISEIFSCGG